MTAWFKSSLALIGKRQKYLAQNEGGQVLFFFAIIAMVLVFFTATLSDYGMTVTQKIKTQTAVDSAALAAGAWVARGGNIQQMINGIHWDMNYSLAQILTISSDISMVICLICLALSWIPFGVGAAFYSVYNATRKIESGIIDACCTVHNVTSKVIDPVQKILVKTTPILAMLHANFSARNNGASSIPELVNDVLPFSASTKQSIDSVLTALDRQNLPFSVYTWTLSPNLKMWNNMEITEVFKYSDGVKAILQNVKNTAWANPYRIGPIMPFTGTLFFWASKYKKLDWNDSFIIQKDKKDELSGDMSKDYLDFSVDIMPHWLNDLADQIKSFFGKIRDGIVGWLKNSIAFLFAWLPDLPCSGGESSDDGSSGENGSGTKEEESSGVEDIAHFTFICGIKSQMGTFLKMFGPTLGEDPQDSNVPMTFAFATAKVRGHPLHPGGLMQDGNGGYQELKLHVVPFWISAEPFFTQTRFVKGYEGDWETTLAPVQFQYSSSDSDTEDSDEEKDGDSDSGKEDSEDSGKPKILEGKLLGINH